MVLNTLLYLYKNKMQNNCYQHESSINLNTATQPGKTNKCIELEKYKIIKGNILSILKKY
jgi:hypothetical protein